MRYNGISFRTALLCSVLITAGAASGCASIVKGTEQTVSLSTVCGGKPVTDASCTLSNSKGQWSVTTPGSVILHKAYGELSVTCSKEGLRLAPVEQFESSAGNSVWGNFIAGGVIGYAIDAGSGAGFEYPQSMTIAFEPPCEPPAADGG